MNSFVKRTVSGTFMLALTVLALYYKGIPLVAYSLIVTILCLLELFYSLKVKNTFAYAINIIFSILILFSIAYYNSYVILSIISIYFIIVSIFYLFSEKLTISNLGNLIFSFVYISIPMGIFLKMGNTDYIWFVFMISWGTDTFAYLVGMLFGKHKLYPSISPKKTIEGSIGGIIGALVLTNIINMNIFQYDIVFVSCTSIIVSIFAEIGDLLASRIKREVGIKDFGNIIMGHGGFLDRFDSIIFVVPLLFSIFYIYGGKF